MRSDDVMTRKRPHRTVGTDERSHSKMYVKNARRTEVVVKKQVKKQVHGGKTKKEVKSKSKDVERWRKGLQKTGAPMELEPMVVAPARPSRMRYTAIGQKSHDYCLKIQGRGASASGLGVRSIELKKLRKAELKSEKKQERERETAVKETSLKHSNEDNPAWTPAPCWTGERSPWDEGSTCTSPSCHVPLRETTATRFPRLPPPPCPPASH